MIVQNAPKQAVPSASSLPISSPAPVAPARASTRESSVATVQTQTQTQTQQPVPTERLSGAVAAVNASLSRAGSSLQFKIDRETNVAIVTMVDAATGDVIRQIPSEEAMAIAHSIDEMLQRTGSSCDSGLFCKQTA